MSEPNRERLRTALKRTASAFKQGEVPFALAGSYALWARGGPESEHDVDFVVAEQDVEAAVALLAEAGLVAERPAEDWLRKIATDGVVVDLLHRAAGEPVSRAFVERSDVLEVLSVRMPVMRATDVISQKLRSLSDHYCDFAPMLAAVRAVREQLDWQQLRVDVADNDYGQAFLFLVDRLGLTTG